MTQTNADQRPADLLAQWNDIACGLHGDPHSVLGLHVDGDTAHITVFRPEATAARIVTPNGTPFEAERVHDEGIFTAAVPASDLGKDGRYDVQAMYADGNALTTQDAYRFWPTLGDVDLHLFSEGKHEELWTALGAKVMTHQGVDGVAFRVWAPNARAVRVIGEFNYWEGRMHPMRRLANSGVWELFIPAVVPGARYKYEVIEISGKVLERADPFAFATEAPPLTSSVVCQSTYQWNDEAWMQQREQKSLLRQPFSTYEMHLGSWKRGGDHGEQYLSYRELAEQLPAYLADMGFTHVEFMPVSEYPFGGSWGYQVSSYYAPTARYGTVDDFKFLVDKLHEAGIGVIVDWVPAHFPKDEWALAQFDGTALYEHADPMKGEHPDWGTLVFNFSRHEVRNFLIANALFWLKEFHIDGLRVDAVASMLYLDYSREPGEWIPNEFGGRENLEAVSFLKEMNETVYRSVPGAVTIAEESTSWPGVSRPTYLGGLGFGFKWNMGWMHDTLDYFAKEPVYRRYHHGELTFGLVYAFSENFALPLSHDEVVHGKGSLIGKMPGDHWQKHANLRSMFGWMWAHPGKKLLFMGGEIAQEREWSHDRSLDWHLASEDPAKGGMQQLVRQLNLTYAQYSALWDADDNGAGFRWIDASDQDNNVLSFMRSSLDGEEHLVCIANLSPLPRHGYRIGLPHAGVWREVLNTDASDFGGSGVGNMGYANVIDESWHGLPAVAEVTLPPLGVIWLAPERS